MRPHHFVPILLLASTFAVFHTVRDHEFVDYDDARYVVENPNLAAGLGREGSVRAFAEPYFANWIPLTSLSLLIDHEIYGLEPAGYLLTNVALHALSALLLFFALARMTRAPWPSAFAAAVFAVHPGAPRPTSSGACRSTRSTFGRASSSACACSSSGATRRAPRS